MKYLFRIYAWQPLFTEVVIAADSDSEALNKVKNLDSNTLDWKNNPHRVERVTYEVFTQSDKSPVK